MAAVLFGATAPAASELAGSVPAFTLAGLLYLGAAIAVFPIVARRPPSRDALVAEWKPAAVAVVAGGAIGPVLLVAGLARTNYLVPYSINLFTGYCTGSFFLYLYFCNISKTKISYIIIHCSN